MDTMFGVCGADYLSYYIILGGEMKKCDCYKEETKTRNITDFERGFQYGLTGKWADIDEQVKYKEGRCIGTRECETCTCGGDTSKCDFYLEKRKGK